MNYPELAQLIEITIPAISHRAADTFRQFSGVEMSEEQIATLIVPWLEQLAVYARAGDDEKWREMIVLTGKYAQANGEPVEQIIAGIESILGAVITQVKIEWSGIADDEIRQEAVSWLERVKVNTQTIQRSIALNRGIVG